MQQVLLILSFRLNLLFLHLILEVGELEAEVDDDIILHPDHLVVLEDESLL